MARKKRRCHTCGKEFASCTCPAYMVFSLKRGYTWGPGHPTPGLLPYWNTGLPAPWGFDDR